MINRKLLSIFALVAMMLMPQASWATLTPRSANGELLKVFVYGTEKTNYITAGGGSFSINSNVASSADYCWDCSDGSATIAWTFPTGITLQAGDVVKVMAAFSAESTNKGIRVRKTGSSEGGIALVPGSSYEVSGGDAHGEFIELSYTIPASGADYTYYNGAAGLKFFRSSSTGPVPYIRSITIERSSSDCNMPEVLTTGATQTWNLTGLATEANTLASGLVSDNLFYSKNIKIDANFESTYYVSFANSGTLKTDLESTSGALMFIVPAGKGTITVNHATRSGSGNNFAVKIGTNDAVTNSGTTDAWTTYLIPYNVSVPTPIWIYNNSGTSTRSHLKDITVAVGGANATIGTTGYTTFANVIPLDLSNITAAHTVTAYYGKTASGSNVTLTSTDASIPAGEGLVLKGTAGDKVFIAATASGTAIDGNKLKGCTAKTAINNETVNKDYFYVLSASAAEFQNIGTYCASNTLNIPAGKAYLDLTGIVLGHALDITFEDENTTAISELSNSKLQGSGEYYDLSGRRVAQPTKGLYIVNGKKVVIK